MNTENQYGEQQDRRGINAADIRSLVVSVHDLDTRVAVLEVRSNTQDDRLARIESSLEKTKESAERILEKLGEHIQQEDRERKKLMFWIITTLIGVIISGGFLFFQVFVSAG